LLILIQSSPVFSKVQYGWYDIDANEIKTLSNIRKTADRVISINNDMMIDIGVGAVSLLADSVTKSRKPRLFELNETKSFFQLEKHKNLLVIDCDKTIMWNDKLIVDQFIERIKIFTSDLGYRRVVIFGDHCCGYIYIYDSNIKKMN
jgi:hypothetical protein